MVYVAERERERGVEGVHTHTKVPMNMQLSRAIIENLQKGCIEWCISCERVKEMHNGTPQFGIYEYIHFHICVKDDVQWLISMLSIYAMLI